MRINNDGVNFILRYEGYSSTPYLCPAGVPTIGYGNTYYPDGRKVTMKDKRINKFKAKDMFFVVVKKYEDAVNNKVTTTLTQNQFNALVSFCYNVGIHAFSLSTLLKKVNKDCYDITIIDEFLRWNKAKGKVIEGLKNRRKEEAAFYFTP
ncbi:lysozyme [Galbibacter pacificus]|uniref:Lysozyme n=1 Tax=Galbibacter pacificus TaxID=2996052 RepID=A0ABT6FR72_9FLAO|nr:lysozyme [Galbibacter pacificus]MDG3581763.1 lysozyme [Galbibacter pacificus]MDG3585763.1 lysozyme [Galbibacter pacificus]